MNNNGGSYSSNNFKKHKQFEYTFPNTPLVINLKIVHCSIVFLFVSSRKIPLLIYAPGSLIKLVYFSRHEDRVANDKRKKSIKERFGVSNGNRRSFPILGGRLHFVKFETAKINECLDFIHSKQLHRGGVTLLLLCLYFISLILDTLTNLFSIMCNTYSRK